MNLSNSSQFFFNNFKIYNNKVAVIWHNKSYTYAEILEKIEYWQDRKSVE